MSKQTREMLSQIKTSDLVWGVVGIYLNIVLTPLHIVNMGAVLLAHALDPQYFKDKKPAAR